METIQESELYTLERDRDRGAFLYRRTSKRYEDIDDFILEIETAFDTIVEHENCGVSIDVRSVAGRNDPAIEKAAKEAQQRHFSRVPRVAFLFATTLGVLQATRYLGPLIDSGQFFVTTDVADAWRFASISDAPSASAIT